MTNRLDVEVRILADALQANRELNRTSRNVRRFSDRGQRNLRPFTAQFGKLGSSIGLVGGGIAGLAAGVIALGAKAVGSAITFDKGFGQIRTIFTGTGEELDQLQDDVVDLSKELGVSANSLIPALYQALSAGIPADNVIDFLRVSGEAAIGGVLSTTTAVNALTGAVIAFSDDGLTAAEASDLLFTAVGWARPAWTSSPGPCPTSRPWPPTWAWSSTSLPPSWPS